MLLRLNGMPDAEFNAMHGATLEFLWEYGVLFENDESVDLLKKAGNSAGADGRIHLKPCFVESMIKRIPPDGFTMAGRDGDKKLTVAPGSIAFRPSTGAPYVFDYNSNARRSATAADARDFTLLADALDGYDMVHSVVSPFDTPGGAENVLMFVNSHRHSTKPSDITVMSAKEVRAIGEISQAIRGGPDRLREMPLTAVDIAMITPLRCAGEQAQAFLECARWGMPIEVLTVPAMGMTAPATIAGSVMAAMADFFAALCLVYLVNPGLGMINTARITPTNMRTTACNYGAPELGMGSAVAAAVCERYHIPTNLYGFGTNAKKSGAQAELEKMTSALALGLSGGAHMVTGGGMLDEALTASAEQLVIDDESIRYIKRLRAPVEIGRDSIGMETVMEGMRTAGCLLAEEHTVRHVRAGELMDCGLEQWQSYGMWEEKGKPDLYEHAHEKTKRILSNHSVADFRPEVGVQIERISAEAMEKW